MKLKCRISNKHSFSRDASNITFLIINNSNTQRSELRIWNPFLALSDPNCTDGINLELAIQFLKQAYNFNIVNTTKNITQFNSIQFNSLIIVSDDSFFYWKLQCIEDDEGCVNKCITVNDNTITINDLND
jgi:hypothetical protein